MVGGGRGIFYKGDGEKYGLAQNWWKDYKVQVGIL
jgi:hypothetical protein